MLLRMETTHISGAGETHRGGRETNEDLLIVEPDLGLYGVLDGMGGHVAGEVAARIARDTLIDTVRQHSANEQLAPRQLLELAIDHAAAAVFNASQEPQYKDMGTTIVACLVAHDSSVVIGHVGDSRAYLLRDDEALQLLTHDHTIVQLYLSPDEAKRSKFRNVLSRYLGNGLVAQADTLVVPLIPGERLLLCSDGLHDCVELNAIQRVLALRVIPRVAAQALVELALNSKATDNVSALVLDVGQP